MAYKIVNFILYLRSKYDKDYDFESANAEIAKELERLTLEKNSVSTTTLSENPFVSRDTSASKNKGPTGDSERVENNEMNSELQMNGIRNVPESDQPNPPTVSNNNEIITNGPITKDNGDNVINYDRSKSFYDNISSQATDRAKG